VPALHLRPEADARLVHEESRTEVIQRRLEASPLGVEPRPPDLGFTRTAARGREEEHGDDELTLHAHLRGADSPERCEGRHLSEARHHPREVIPARAAPIGSGAQVRGIAFRTALPSFTTTLKSTELALCFAISSGTCFATLRATASYESFETSSWQRFFAATYWS
jgi:hypothetical protein